MSKTQQTFVKVLKEKKRVIGPSKYTVNRWENGKTSPTLETMDKVCVANEIEPPFFFDGKVESLVAFNKKIGSKMGFKIQITFES